MATVIQINTSTFHIHFHVNNRIYTIQFITPHIISHVVCFSGKVMGGCSTLNYMIWVRGHADDYNGWSSQGCSGWSYQDVLPHFKEIENATTLSNNISELRGKSGEIHVTHLPTPNPSVDAFLKACQSHGIPINPDYNAEDMIGAAHIQTSIYQGKRWNGGESMRICVFMINHMLLCHNSC